MIDLYNRFIIVFIISYFIFSVIIIYTLNSNLYKTLTKKDYFLNID